MAKHCSTQTACLLYLVISGHILVDCRRIQDISRNQNVHASKEVATVDLDSEGGHPWCNLKYSFGFSKKTRSYHFDVELSDKHCEDGACMAIELVRDAENPQLIVHPGQSWLVKKDDTEKDKLKWDLFSAKTGNHEAAKRVIDLKTVELVHFFPAEGDKPDKLEITIGADATSKADFTSKEIFELEGGLYYSEYLLNQGMEKVLGNKEFSEIEEDATAETYAATGSRWGRWTGAGSGALAVGGFYTAASVTGALVQTQALVAASLMGVVGGAVVGGMLFGFVGVGIAGVLVMSGSKKIHGYTITAASRKIFEKLRCLYEFKECDTNVLVPKDKECPRK